VRIADLHVQVWKPAPQMGAAGPHLCRLENLHHNLNKRRRVAGAAKPADERVPLAPEERKVICHV